LIKYHSNFLAKYDKKSSQRETLSIFVNKGIDVIFH
jgi:hypothetical protein